MADRPDYRLHLGTGTGKHVLVKNEEWLNRPNRAIRVPDREVAKVKSLTDCVFDQLVEAMVLPLTAEGMPPVRAPCQVRAPHHIHAAASCLNDFRLLHGEHSYNFRDLPQIRSDRPEKKCDAIDLDQCLPT
jgi:hypothetical protein